MDININRKQMIDFSFDSIDKLKKIIHIQADHQLLDITMEIIMQNTQKDQDFTNLKKAYYKMISLKGPQFKDSFKNISILAQEGIKNNIKLLAIVDDIIILTKHEVSQLMSMMFFCFFQLNYSQLYQDKNIDRSSSQFNKLLCLFEYFNRVYKDDFINNSQKVHYEKLKSNKNFSMDLFQNSKISLTQMKILQNGLESHKYAIQINFANKYLGGGMLRTGCVQEEIRMTISPELIPSMLFFPEMKPNEAVMVIGAEQISKYSGYSNSFTYQGEFYDNIEVDSLGRKNVTVVSIDAINFSQNPSSQYDLNSINREIYKALIGFQGSTSIDEKVIKKEIATGKWGCGAFKGNVQLKFFIQWIAASLSFREINFYAYDFFPQEIYQLIKEFQQKSVGDAIKFLMSFCYNSKETELTNYIKYYQMSQKNIF